MSEAESEHEEAEEVEAEQKSGLFIYRSSFSKIVVLTKILIFKNMKVKKKKKENLNIVNQRLKKKYTHL